MLKIMSKTVQYNLHNILEDRGMTQKELADKTGLNENTIGRVCRNASRQIHKGTVEKICQQLGITPGELIIMDEVQK